MDMDNKTTPAPVYHHHRAPRTPESYFNVPESIALLNIVKSERIQNAFQSNRKNHASVWEMVAEVLNRYSARKRSAKQCCNRYENLKKIYTQLKKNPERHVRRNWPYMFLFKEIEEQRGECWGSSNKRLALINKTHNELSYYHRRRQAATEFGVLLDKQAQAAVVAQQNLLQTLAAQSNDSNTSNATAKLERFLPNHFVETQLGADMGGGGSGGGNDGVNNSREGTQGPSAETNANNTPALSLSSHDTTNAALAVSLSMSALNTALYSDNATPLALQTTRKNLNDLTNALTSHHNNHLRLQQQQQQQQQHKHQQQQQLTVHHAAHCNGHLESSVKESLTNNMEYEKDCNGALNLQTNDNNMSLKSEPMSDGEFNPDDIQLMQTNYNGGHNFYTNNIDTNILHPDVIVDTDNLTDFSSTGGDGVSAKSKRKLSTTSTDGGDSTNYELIEYLKRREKRDEQMLQRMEAREDRLLNLLERAVQAIEAMSHKNCSSSHNINKNNNNNTHNNNNSRSQITINANNSTEKKTCNAEKSSGDGNGSGNGEEYWTNNKLLEKLNEKS